jgi:hypothetical protein
VGYVRARRVSITGLFLGWAGPALAVGGTVVGLQGDEPPGIEGRRLIQASLVGGVALSSVGLGLQVAGSSWSGARLRHHGLPDARARRRFGAALAVGAGVLGGLTAWRVLEPSPDGLWLPVAGGGALVGTLGTTALFTVVLLDADAEVAQGWPSVRVTVAPGGVRVVGRW